MPDDREERIKTRAHRIVSSDITSEDLAKLRMQRILGRLGDMKPMPSHEPTKQLNPLPNWNPESEDTQLLKMRRMFPSGQAIETPPPPDPNVQQMQGLPRIKAEGIRPDPVRAPLADFAEKHPFIQGAGDFGSGGATDPNSEMGPLDVFLAGIPFIKELTPYKMLFHGTGDVFEHFNPQLGHSYLPKSVHGAEIPDVADYFAQQRSEPRNWGKDYPPAPNVIPMTLDVKNALDISGEEVDPADLEILRSWVSKDPEKWRRDVVRGLLKDMGQSRDEMIFKGLREKSSGLFHSFAQPLRRRLYDIDEILRMHPEILDETGFDAVKYGYSLKEGDKAWATFDPSKIKTPWGVPLGKKK